MWYIAALLALAAGCGLLLRKLRAGQNRQQELIRRLRTSGMYAGVYAMFTEARKGHVERVTLSGEEVTVVMLYPEGRKLQYVFDRHGIDPLSDEMLRALCQAAVIDLPCLRDRRYYTFHADTRVRGAGNASHLYQYIINQERKDYLLHAIREKNRQISH